MLSHGNQIYKTHNAVLVLMLLSRTVCKYHKICKLNKVG